MNLSKRTTNSIFMTPTLGIDLDILNRNGYINSYGVDGMRFEQYEDAVYLLFKPTNFIAFTSFVEREYTRGIIIDDYDYEEGHVVLVYQLSPAYKSDFDLVRKGKYSETSNIFQELFKEEITIELNGKSTKEKSFQNLIFYRSKKLRDYWEEKTGFVIPNDKEVWPIYDINDETLNYDRIIKE